MDSYDEDDLLATSPGLPLGSKALPCDDMLVYSEEKYDKTTTAEAFAIVFIVLIVVGGCIACSVFAFMSQRRQRMLYEENEKKRQAQLANAAPIVHAPPVVQPAVQRLRQPQAGYAPQGPLWRPPFPRRPRDKCIPAPARIRPPARSRAGGAPRAPEPWFKAATRPGRQARRALSTPQIHIRRPGPCLSTSHHAALSRSPLALLK